MTARGLTLASAAGLAAALGVIALFGCFGGVDDVRMAVAMIAMPTLQLAVRAHIRRTRPG